MSSGTSARWSFRPRRLLNAAILPLALAAIAWSAVGLHLRESHALAERAAAAEAEHLARSLEQITIRMAEASDQLLRFVQMGYRLDPAGFDLLAWADAYRPADALSVQLAVIGADGRLRASSVDPSARPVDLSDRPHFRVHAASGGIDRLYISDPVRGRVSGRWTIQFTRPLRDATGRFHGVAVLSLDIAYLESFLEAVRAPHARLSLIARDGVVLARAPHLEDLGTRLDARQVERLSATNASRFTETDAATGRDWLVNARAVLGYPLLVVARLDLTEAMSAYVRTRNRLLAGTAMATLLLLAAGLLLSRQRQRITETSHALEVTLDRMTQGVVMAAPDGRVVVMNDRARALLALRRRDGPGMPAVDLLARLGPPAPGGGAGQRERVTAEGHMIASEVLPLPRGGLVLTITDVTTERTAAAAQTAARQAAEEANRAKSDFLANMSHEIRTPMNGVIGLLQVLRHSGLSPDQRRMADTITRSANALLTVLNDILDYSKLEAGRITLEPLACSVADLVEDVGGLMRGSAEAKGVSLVIEHRAVPPTVVVDPVRLRQILMNFLSNAVKFSEIGEIRVLLDAAPDPEDAARSIVTIAVRDQGIGIAPAALERLFTRFMQADGSSTRRFGGTGLGLAISRELARLMGGDISVRSVPEEGSEFTLRLSLPVTDAAPHAGHDDEAAEVPPGPQRILDILVAEDDEVNRIVIAAFLQPHGHRVTFAYNGVDAVLQARRAQFDLVLMDVMMPGMDGPEATRRIRDLSGAAAAVPIVALTANAMAGDRERYLAAGMNAYVSKPINRRELFRTVEKLLDARCFRRDLAEPAAAAPEPAPVGAGLDAELDALFGGLSRD